MSRSLILRPSAKVNLALRVYGRREDGFHDVRTLLQSIALSDRIVVTERPGPFALRVRGVGAPTDRTNLVWRAAEALWRAIGRAGDPRGVHLTLEKQIPAAAGLGGGSADAAAALAGLNRIWQAGWPAARLARLAVELGADVPFFLYGGTALGVGRGDELYPVEDIRRLGVVVIKPSFGVSTASAYGWLDEDRRAGIAELPDGTPAEVDVGWAAGGVTLLNDLGGAVARRHPEIDTMAAALRALGAFGAAMSGSGSAVFGLFSEAGARAAVRRLQRPGWLVLLTRTLTRREARSRVGL